MRRKDKEITDPAQVYDVVKRARFCRIAMCDGDEPYVFPVNYGYSEGVLYVHSAPEGRKLDILERNDRVCFQVSDRKDCGKNGLPAYFKEIKWQWCGDT